MSIQGILGAMIYILVVIACLAANARQRPGSRITGFWIGAAGFFTLLILLRIFDLQEIARKYFKAKAMATNAYAMRRVFQTELLLGVMAVALILGAVALIMFWPRIKSRVSAQAITLAILGMAGHILLVIVRIISLHAADRVLYGPAHANWVLDLSCSALVGYAAMRVVFHSRAPHPR